MTDLIGFLGDVFAMELGTLGTVTITLGWILAGGAVTFLALSVYRRVRGR